MKIRRVAVIVAVATLAVVAWAAKVTTDWDHGVDFSQFHSYAWAEGTPLADQLMQSRAVSTIDAQLQGKGLKKMDAGADLLVALHAAHKDEVQLDSTGFGPGWGGWGGFGMSTTTEQTIPIGSLLVDLVNAKSNKLVWRATGSEVIPNSPDKETKDLEKMIVKMFADYPPSSAAK